MSTPAFLADTPVSALLDGIANLLADKVAERLGARRSPAYATAKSNPIGSPRAFLDAARRGEFPSFKRRREITAHWVDVERYVESRRRPARVRADPADDDRALLQKAGMRLRAANDGASRR